MKLNFKNKKIIFFLTTLVFVMGVVAFSNVKNLYAQAPTCGYYCQYCSTGGTGGPYNYGNPCSWTCGNWYQGSWQSVSCTGPKTPCTGPQGETIAPDQSVIYYSTSTAQDCNTVKQTRTCTGGGNWGPSSLSGTATNASCTPFVSCTGPDNTVIQSGSSKTYYNTTTSSDCSADSQTRTCTNGSLSGSYTNASCAAPTPTPTGTSDSNLFGYAWSSTIGWISMSGTGYGVELNASDQTLSGYAWSPNIGWIQFGGLLTGFPSGPGTISADAKYDTVNNKLTGWIKAISADNNGWDGWISLSGTGYSVNVDSTNGNFSGWAWGSNVVGWVDFSEVKSDVISNDGVCAIFPTGSSQPNSLPVIGNLCNPGMATTPTEATTTDTSTPANSTDVDYYYTWTCNSLSGGNPSPLCEVTTESKNFTDGQIQSIVARLTPSIVKTKDDPCTVLWTTPSDMVCRVEKAGSVHTDFNNNATDGHQVEVGENYQVVCKDSATQNIITAKSQLLKCALNPSVREI